MFTPEGRRVRARGFRVMMVAVGVVVGGSVAAAQECVTVETAPPAVAPGSWAMSKLSFRSQEDWSAPENRFWNAEFLWNDGPYGPWSIGLGLSPWYSSTAGVAGTESVVPCESQVSSCWRIDPQLPVIATHTTPRWGNTRGFPLNVDVYNLPVTTNYPPLAHAGPMSTAPLLSTPGEQTYRPLFLADRKTVAGVVDPMTGQPLLREVDLELPLGQATFRMVRTYGGNVDGSTGPYGKVMDGQGDRLAIGKLWDWAGTGWMISENPILLFDSQYIQHDPHGSRRCYLILDAHHSIPFTQDVQTGNYVAPAWCDAIMSWREQSDGMPVGGSYNELSGKWVWEHPPRTVTVRLYGESVTYTFRINTGTESDTSPLTDSQGGALTSNAHDSPSVVDAGSGALTVEPPSTGNAGGLGTPVTGLLEQIEDRYGNRVEFEHCPNRRAALPSASNEVCTSCVQTCAEKGQLRTAKLYRGGSASPDWTLVYVHRSFRVWAPDAADGACIAPTPPDGAVPINVAPTLLSAVDTESKWFLQNALHAVYVYRNAVSLPTIASDKWTMPAEAFIGEYDHQSGGFTQTYSGLDAQDASGWTERKILEHLGWSVPAGWSYRLRFTYDETIQTVTECRYPEKYYSPARDGNVCCIPRTPPDSAHPCLSVPLIVPSRLTRFGVTPDLADVPGIFYWGTPLYTTFAPDGITPRSLQRLTPCLLRVEKTTRRNPDIPTPQSFTEYTAYCYATHLDDATALLKSVPAIPGQASMVLALDNLNCLKQIHDHTSAVVIPKLKHILRTDRLRAAMVENGSTSINSIFDPGNGGADSARNRRSYADIANLTLDWQGLSAVTGEGQSVPDPGLSARRGPWVNAALVGECIVSQVARERMIVRDDGGVALVGRVRLNEGGSRDGIYATSGGTTTYPIAEYQYAAATMRAGVTLGPRANPTTQHDAIVQSFARPIANGPVPESTPALPGLDRFGRVRDLNCLSGITLDDNDTRARRQLRYNDLRGGVLQAERVTQIAQTGGAHETTGVDRSWLYTYDGFSRLATAATGTLNDTWAFDTSNKKRFSQLWKLDELGNWFGDTGSNVGAGFTETWFDQAGEPVGIERHRSHKTNSRNEIGSQIYAGVDHSTGEPIEQADIKYAYDPAGRMVYDGRVVYEHDAFGRLIQVRELLSPPQVQTDGTYTIPNNTATGRLIVHYSYDALGRLIRTQRPNSPSGERLAVTDLHYDGVRVVQEVGWASVAGVSAGNGQAYLPRPARDMASSNPPTSLPSGEANGCSPLTTSDWNWTDRRLEREYLWHSDPAAYVDDCAAELVYTQAHAWNGTADEGNDTTATILYVLADHNATVIALTDALGRVVTQYSYTPYGDLLATERFLNGSDSLATESLAAADGHRLGHQGLRTERFDRPWDGSMDIDSAVPTGTGSTGAHRALCHNRNRMYDPAEGRFTGQDPNGLGLPVLSRMLTAGDTVVADVWVPSVPGHYGDGMNAHGAYNALPRTRRDANALFVSPADLGGAAVMGVIRGLRGGLDSITSVYADNLDYDIDWAQDWGSPDDWHSRLDNSWVPDAWAEGIRGGLQDWLEEDVLGLLGPLNPGNFDQHFARITGGVPGPSPTWRVAARAVNATGRVAHHVISFYKSTAARMKQLEHDFNFKFDLHSLNNMLPLKQAQHGMGRHRRIYHERVFVRLRGTLEKSGKFGEDAKRIFLAELEAIKQDIARNPTQWFGP